MYSSLLDRISKPGPNLTLALKLSKVAGWLNRAEGGGFGGFDCPGAAAPPDEDGASVSAGVPVSAADVPLDAEPPAAASPSPPPAGVSAPALLAGAGRPCI